MKVVRMVTYESEDRALLEQQLAHSLPAGTGVMHFVPGLAITVEHIQGEEFATAGERWMKAAQLARGKGKAAMIPEGQD